MKKTRTIRIGNIKLGGGNRVRVQSMCSTRTSDVDSTLKQIHELEDAGCEIIRVAVPDYDSANALREIKRNISIPLVADIHFDYRLAIESARYADKLRINPGNIGNKDKVKQVIKAAKDNSLPIRIGINLGSLEKDVEKKHGKTAKAMVESAKNHLHMLESEDFYDSLVSLKASDIGRTVSACRLFADEFDYPQHIGITEAGTVSSGTIKSAIGIGILLHEGIGDTIRVSLSGNPVNEVMVAKQILRHLNLRKGLEVTACPTCARSGIDVDKYANDIEKKFGNIESDRHIAVMGCVVNGPGEAKSADIGIVGDSNDKGNPLLYVHGDFVRKIKENNILKIIDEELKK